MLRILAAWILIVAALTPQIFAAPDDTVIPFDSSVAGSYLVTSDGKGNFTVNPTRVVRPGPAPGPVPPPNPPPTPPVTERGKAVMAAAQAVTGDPDRAGTAHGLAELYRQISKTVRANPTVSPAALTQALSTANNTFLASRNLPAPGNQWQPVRDKIGTYWTILAQANAPVVSYADLLDESAAGLDASAPPANAGISPDMLKLIMMIIQIILSILKIPVPTSP